MFSAFLRNTCLLSAALRNSMQHLRALTGAGALECCGKGAVLREIIGPVLLKMSWCAEKEGMRKGEKEVDNEGEGRRESKQTDYS